MTFTRVNEEVDVDSSWLYAVRDYVKIDAMNNYNNEKLALSKLKTKREKEHSQYSKAMVIDINSYFTTPYELKSVDDLVLLYSNGPDYVKEQVTYAFKRKFCEK